MKVAFERVRVWGKGAPAPCRLHRLPAASGRLEGMQCLLKGTAWRRCVTVVAPPSLPTPLAVPPALRDPPTLALD
jgi:hypothetical protein